MKRPFFIICLVLVAATVIGSADFIVQRSLDRYLPGLLTRELGLPVTLAPIRADVLTLTAYTDRLQMGPDDDPAVVASGVVVSLNWTDLLAGEIRLVEAGGDDLMLKVSSWPGSDDPLPTDYFFLDPWLPASIDLARMRNVFEDGSTWNIEAGQWRRTGDGEASLAWHEQRPAGSFDLEVSIESLEDLLGMKQVVGSLTMSVAEQKLPDSTLDVRIAPGPDQGYTLELSGLLAGMTVKATAAGARDWAWPTQSSSRVKTLYPGRVIELVKLFLADGTEGDLEQELQGPLPALSLPYHEGTVELDEIRIGDEMVHDNRIEFLADGARLAVTDIILNGPSGKLRGAAAAVSIAEGWEVAVGTDVAARESDAGLLNRYIEAEWYFDRGKLRLKSRGATWGSLLDGMAGVVEMHGLYRAAVDTPVSVNARLGGSPTEFVLEDIALQLGKSTVTGNVQFSGGAERKLHIKARASDLDLKFLFEGEAAATRPGIALPEFLVLFPSIDVTWDVDIDGVVLPSLELASATMDISRTASGGHMVIAGVGMQNGKADLRLDYDVPETGPAPVRLKIDLERIDISRTLGQQGGMETRTTGVLNFSSSGNSVPEVFSALRGDADLAVEFRKDGDWNRETRPEESVQFKGNSRLLINENRIVGLEIDNIALHSAAQDLRGKVSVAVARQPFMIATLDSDRLDIAQLLELMPDSPEAEAEESLKLLRELNQTRLDISIGELLWFEEPISDIEIRLEGRPMQFEVSRLDFTYPAGRVSSKMTLAWKPDSAELTASGTLSSLGLEQLLDRQQSPSAVIPGEELQGDFNLSGSGATLQDILANLSGRVTLSGQPGQPGQPVDDRPATRLDIQMKRAGSGMSANVNALVLAGSDLKGSVFFAEQPRRQLRITLNGGVLDLEPWERQFEEDRAKKKDDPDARERTTQFIGDVLTAPLRLFGDDVGVTKSGERIFTSDPLDLEDFQSWDVSVKGKLDRLNSKLAELRGLDLDMQLDYGVLRVKSQAAYVDQGSGWANLNFDSTASPPTLKGEILLRDTRGKREKTSFPRSAHTVFDSHGVSQADLAGNLNGIAYFDAGRGPLDYSRISFLTADAATTLIRGLIPSAKDKQPELHCAVTLMQFTDGKGITPYGYAARTHTANLLGGIEVDLKKEELTLRFRSRSREGVGLSVGNAFSNTVDIAGSLSDPKIVPNTPGLLVRGWAAFMTAGLSVVGESVLNRALASKNPCEDIREQIRKDLCSSTLPLHDSPIACPANTAPAGEDASGEPAAQPSPAIGPESE